MDKTAKGSLLILAASLIWGATPIIEKIAVQIVEPIAVSGWRFFLAGLIALALLKGKKISLKTGRHEKIVLLLAAVTGAAAAPFLWYTGLTLTSAVTASLVERLEPLWVGLIGFLLLKERVKKDEVLGTALVSAGVLAAVSSITFDASLGVLMILFASFGWALQIVLTKDIIKRLNPWVTFTYEMLVGGFVSLVAGYFLIGNSVFSFPIQGWYYVLALSLFASVIAGSLFFFGLKMIEAERASAITSTMPLFTIIFSAAFLNEALSVQQMAGAALIVCGVIVLAAAKRVTWSVRHSLSLAIAVRRNFVEEVKFLAHEFISRF